MTASQLNDLQKFAKLYASQGFAVTPLPPRSKRAVGDGWTTAYLTGDAITSHWSSHANDNIGVVLGPSRVCSLDIDDTENARAVMAEFGIDIDALRDEHAHIIGNPARFRVVFRAPDGIDLTTHKLQWPRRDEPGKYQGVLEFRAGPAQDVYPPSVHPDGYIYTWGKTPKQAGGLKLPPEDLILLWQNWSVFNENAKKLCPWAPKQEPRAPRAPSYSSGGPNKTIAAYNTAHSITDALERYGYKKKGRRYLSPHSSTGIAGVLVHEDNKACILHGSDPLCFDATGQLVSPFDLFMFYEHGNDFARAATAAERELGIEKPRRQKPPKETIDPDTGEIHNCQPEQPANDNHQQVVHHQPSPEDRAETRGKFLDRIAEGGTLDQFEALGRDVKFCTSIAPSDREIIAKALQQAIKTFCDVRLPIPTLRAWVGLAGVGRSDVVPLTRSELESVPKWAQPWAFRQDTDQMFSIETKTSISPRAFDFEHNRFLTWEMRDSTGMTSATEFCRELWHTPIIDSAIYLPMADAMFTMDGKRYGNTYRPDLVPDGIPPQEWSDDANDAVQRVRDHIARIVPDEKERRTLIQWLAHNVVRPGEKINWSPIIIGNYGDGKSVLANLLGEVMGRANVNIIGGEVLVSSQFNGWAEGAAVVAIEEVRVSGHNRFEVMDKLKPLITNDRISIHPKHRDPYTMPNVVNYMMFSNHLDAAPLDEKDRRYYVLITPFVGKSRQWIAEGAGMDSGYFTALFDGIRDHYREIRGWLESVDLEGFQAKGNAPVTNAKQRVVEFCRSDDEIAIGDILEDGALGVTGELFSSTSLCKALEASGKQVPRTQTLNRILQMMGYTQLPVRVKWDGDRHRVWVSDAYSLSVPTETVRTVLEATRFRTGAG